MERKKQWAKLLFYTVLLFMLFSLAVYAYLGTFTRYMADDYCSAAALKSGGFWGSQVHWWQTWSGRYSFTFIISFVELFGVGIVPVLPALALSVWVFSITWVCLPLLKRLKVSNYISAGLFIASVVLWLTYRSINDYPQVVFWQTGILTYPVSPIMFLLGTGIAIRRSFIAKKVDWLELLLWFLFAVLAGGFSETGVVVQIVLLALLVIISSMANKEQRNILTPILLVTLCGSLFSLLIMASSPGNEIRPGGFQNIPPLTRSLPGSLVETLLFLPNFIKDHTSVFIFAVLAGAFLVYFCIPEEIRVSNLSIARYFALSLIFSWVGIWAGIGPAYVLRIGLPPERVLLFTYFLVACVMFFWGTLGALLLRWNLPPATLVMQGLVSFSLVLFLIGWSVFPFVISQLQMASPLRQYSILWDERHQSLLEASQNPKAVVVTRDFIKVDVLYRFKDKLWLVGDFDTNPGYWINRCAAQYYGVDQIIAK